MDGLGVTGQESASPDDRYSGLTFVATLANIVFVILGTWIFMPYFLFLIYTAPFLLIDLIVAIILVRRPGKPGQVGRGMLIGWIAVPLSLVTLVAAGFAMS